MPTNLASSCAPHAGREVSSSPFAADSVREPSRRTVILALGLCLILVMTTRIPIARSVPMESDEYGFLEQVSARWMPIHHTLFMALGRSLGTLLDDTYRGFIVLDMVMSALALWSTWWWLRALGPPGVAAAATFALGAGPVFWGYGGSAGNYPAIVAVGSFLLGVAVRGNASPRPWYPFAAAAVLAFGAGYRQDIGTYWLGVLVVILWQHRWRRAILAGTLFVTLNLCWLLPMLHEVGGWARWRAASADFAYQAGYLNSVWNLGLVDAPLRYAVKMAMALIWTLGPALLFVPRGMIRAWQRPDGLRLAVLLSLAAAPAIGAHMLVHFGVPGYAFHYIPALVALIALGIGRVSRPGRDGQASFDAIPARSAAFRLACCGAMMAAVFLVYPTDFRRPGWRGSFDLSFARFTRHGLSQPIPNQSPAYWRTANSRTLAGTREWPSGKREL